MLMADLFGLNTEKAIRMALLHDLPEVEIGDLTPSKKGNFVNFTKIEDEAMVNLLSILDGKLTQKYLEIWNELRAGSSQEAKLVAQADKVEMLIQNIEYHKEGWDSPRLEQFWATEITDGPLSDLVKTLIIMRKTMD